MRLVRFVIYVAVFIVLAAYLTDFLKNVQPLTPPQGWQNFTSWTPYPKHNVTKVNVTAGEAYSMGLAKSFEILDPSQSPFILREGGPLKFREAIVEALSRNASEITPEQYFFAVDLAGFLKLKKLNFTEFFVINPEEPFYLRLERAMPTNVRDVTYPPSAEIVLEREGPGDFDVHFHGYHGEEVVRLVAVCNGRRYVTEVSKDEWNWTATLHLHLSVNTSDCGNATSYGCKFYVEDTLVLNLDRTYAIDRSFEAGSLTYYYEPSCSLTCSANTCCLLENVRRAPSTHAVVATDWKNNGSGATKTVTLPSTRADENRKTTNRVPPSATLPAPYEVHVAPKPWVDVPFRPAPGVTCYEVGKDLWRCTGYTPGARYVGGGITDIGGVLRTVYSHHATAELRIVRYAPVEGNTIRVPVYVWLAPDTRMLTTFYGNVAFRVDVYKNGAPALSRDLGLRPFSGTLWVPASPGDRIRAEVVEVLKDRGRETTLLTAELTIAAKKPFVPTTPPKIYYAKVLYSNPKERTDYLVEYNEDVGVFALDGGDYTVYETVFASACEPMGNVYTLGTPRTLLVDGRKAGVIGIELGERAMSAVGSRFLITSSHVIPVGTHTVEATINYGRHVYAPSGVSYFGGILKTWQARITVEIIPEDWKECDSCKSIESYDWSSAQVPDWAKRELKFEPNPAGEEYALRAYADAIINATREMREKTLDRIESKGQWELYFGKLDRSAAEALLKYFYLVQVPLNVRPESVNVTTRLEAIVNRSANHSVVASLYTLFENATYVNATFLEMPIVTPFADHGSKETYVVFVLLGDGQNFSKDYVESDCGDLAVAELAYYRQPALQNFKEALKQALEKTYNGAPSELVMRRGYSPSYGVIYRADEKVCHFKW